MALSYAGEKKGNAACLKVQDQNFVPAKQNTTGGCCPLVAPPALCGGASRPKRAIVLGMPVLGDDFQPHECAD